MLAVVVDAGPEFKVGETTVLFEEPFVLDPANVGIQTYDVSADGQEFLMVRESGDAASTPRLIVASNWFEELKARVPSGR